MKNDISNDKLRKQVCKIWSDLGTFFVHEGRPDIRESGSFPSIAVARGSTVLFPSIEDMKNQGKKTHDHETIYGAMGNPVQHELEKVIARLEGGTHTQITSSGLSACTIALLSFLKQGDHLLLADSVYGPTRDFSVGFLKRFGVETDFYPPLADEKELKNYIKPNTKVIFAESPGSHSFEVQDIAMLAKVAKISHAKVIIDNTWGIAAFKPFEHGVDVSIQALTKYPGGHSDIILGAISVNSSDNWKHVRNTALILGECGSPDDCWLALRGLHTMGVRLEKQSVSAFNIALWLNEQPQVKRVFHPALPGSPGHLIWKRDFNGASSVFSFEFKEEISAKDVTSMINALHLFGIGVSWGGYESLIIPTEITRNFPCQHKGICVRLQIGLEREEDLIKDLQHGFKTLS